MFLSFQKAEQKSPSLFFFCNDYQIEEGVLPDVQDIIQKTCAGFLKGQMSQLGISFPIILYAAQMIVGKWTMTIFPSPNNLTLVYKSLMTKKMIHSCFIRKHLGKGVLKIFFGSFLIDFFKVTEDVLKNFEKKIKIYMFYFFRESDSSTSQITITLE